MRYRARGHRLEHFTVSQFIEKFMEMALLPCQRGVPGGVAGGGTEEAGRAAGSTRPKWAGGCAAGVVELPG